MGAATMTVMRRLGAMLLLACLLAGAARAEDCVFQRFPDIPVTFLRGRPAVPVGINGQGVLFMLDTGLARTVITPATQTRLELPFDARYSAKSVGAGGAVAVRYAKLKTFEFSGHRFTDQSLPVVEMDKPLGAGADEPNLYAGAIGGDLLLTFEVELDFPNKLMRLYNRPACYGTRSPWTVPHATIPIRVTMQFGAVLPVKVNGTPLRGLLDTGASEIVLTLAAASTAGIDAATLRKGKTVATSGAGGLSGTAWMHQAQTLDVGEEHLKNRTLLVQDFKLPDADMLIGEAYIQSHKIWLSYSTGQMFVQIPGAK
jgi:predicted aspartyl protease